MRNIYLHIDKIIAEIAQHSDQRAFRSFYDLFYNKLFHFALAILRNEAVAKDVVLETFEKVWEQRKGLQEIENINTYLYVLIKNKSIDVLRRKKELIVRDGYSQPFKESIIINHPEKILLDKELYEKLNQAILNLPEKCRLVYRLVKEDGLKYKEVSDLLNLSPKTVDNHINNAMGKIREEVNQYLGHNENRNIALKIVK